MHQVYKTTGFVFKKENRMDADRIFSVFAKDIGRVEIFAKSIRAITSKLRGGIDIFGVSDIEFVQGKNRKTLTDTISSQKFSSVMEIPEKMEIAHKAASIIDTFIKGQESDEKIWNVIVDFFKKLDDCNLSSLNLQLAYYYFFWNFVSALGYKPELYQCVHCSQMPQPDNLYFSNKEGGILCASCFQQNGIDVKIHQDVVKILRLFLANDWQTMSKIKITDSLAKSLEENLSSYANYLAGMLN